MIYLVMGSDETIWCSLEGRADLDMPTIRATFDELVSRPSLPDSITKLAKERIEFLNRFSITREENLLPEQIIKWISDYQPDLFACYLIAHHKCRYVSITTINF